MMNSVLFVTRHDPFKRFGGGLASRAFLNAFLVLYPNVLDLVLADECQVDEILEIHQIYKVKRRNIFKRLFSLLTGSLHRFTPFVEKLVLNNEYSLCILDGSIIGGDLVPIMSKKGIKIITIHHNFEQKYHMDNKTVECFWGLFPYYIRRNEKKAYLGSSLNLFLTSSDLLKFSTYYGKTAGYSSVIGCFEPIRESCRHSTSVVTFKNDKPTLIISGSMNTNQTVNSLLDFYRNYWDITSQILGDFHLILTGRDPSPNLINTIGSNINVEVIPNPQDMSKIISKGDIYICPTSLGGGLKLRLMDGLKNGLLILVHEVSARGYDVLFDEPWFKVYSDYDSYAKGLEDLKKMLNNNWGEKISQKYETNFSFDAGVERLSGLLKELEI